MVGSVAPSSARGRHSVDRFYNPPQRRQLQQQQQQQQQRRQEQQKQNQFQEKNLQMQIPAVPRAARMPSTPQPPVATHVDVRQVESQLEFDEPSASYYPCRSSSPKKPDTSGTNVDCFLQSTTPSVRARNFSKRTARGCELPDDPELCSYFSLEDLWESYREWSAYGAEVPLVINGSEKVIQYYVPSLSAIQLYVHSNFRPRYNNSELHGDTKRNESSESVADEQSYGIPDVNESHAGLEGSSSKDGDIQRKPHLTFEYLEIDKPHLREPLANKVSVLAKQFPELNTYRSCDLHPSSWLSVSWYPIYRIPTGPILRDLDTCFLTFHMLGTPSKSIPVGFPDLGSCSVKKESGTTEFPSKLSLHIFGLASYKFSSALWTTDELCEEKLDLLLQTADQWLKNLQVVHHDFIFFSGRRRSVYQR